MPASPVPNPNPITSYNDAFAGIAEQLAASAQETIGSQAWIERGEFPEPFWTGGHWSEGWNRSHYFAGKKDHYLALSNAAARPNVYAAIFQPARNVGYGLGERPIGWAYVPGGRDAMDGGQMVGGIAVYGADSEHFLKEPLFSCFEVTKGAGDFPLPPMTWSDGSPIQWSAWTLANILTKIAQWSCVGEIRAWFNAKSGTDRSNHRLLYALGRSSHLVGIEGNDANDATAWVKWLYAKTLAGGPIEQTIKIIETAPQVSLPYYNPTQFYGYGIPAWYWIRDLAASVGLDVMPLVQKLCAELIPIMDPDGAFPWAIDMNGVKGYFTPANGDKYTPGFENYAALRIAEALGVSGAAERAQSVLARWGTLPGGDTKELQRGWFVTENRELVS